MESSTIIIKEGELTQEISKRKVAVRLFHLGNSKLLKNNVKTPMLLLK